MQHAGSSVEACELLVAAGGISFPDQGLNAGSLHWQCGAFATGHPGTPQIHLYPEIIFKTIENWTVF